MRLQLVAILAGAALIAGCSSSSDSDVAAGSTSNGPPPTSTSASTAAVLRLGMPVAVTDDLKGTTMRVNVSDLAKAKLAAMATKPKGVEYQVLVTATGVEGQGEINPLDFKARDAEGDSFTADLGQVEGQLDGGTVTAGQNLRGLVSFDVPAGKTIDVVIYAPLGGDPVTWHA